MNLKLCQDCKKLMRLEVIDGRDYLICDYCKSGFVIPKKNCEHIVDSIIFGVNNLAYCQDCGNLLAYEQKE